jgi:hypothetical protein
MAVIALELRESSRGSEPCSDGCGDQIACCVWVHRGREYTEPPVAMIVDAILAHVYGASSGAPVAANYELPDNLAHFFAASSGGACPIAPAPRTSCRRSCCASTATPARSSTRRRLLTMTELNGLTHARAAARVGLTTSGMKSRAQRARAQLRELLTACCEIELDRRGGITSYRARGACDCGTG